MKAKYTIFLLSAFLLSLKLGGQTLPAPSISIEFYNDIEKFDIGGSYTVSGRIIHDGNYSNISAGIPINYFFIVTNKNGTTNNSLKWKD